jgi:hypothetical protein
MTELVTCEQCAGFEPPLPMYEKNSMGSCRSFDAGVVEIWRTHGRKPYAKEYDAAMKARGSKLFYPRINRYCRLFKPL